MLVVNHIIESSLLVHDNVFQYAVSFYMKKVSLLTLKLKIFFSSGLVYTFHIVYSNNLLHFSKMDVLVTLSKVAQTILADVR